MAPAIGAIFFSTGEQALPTIQGYRAAAEWRRRALAISIDDWSCFDRHRTAPKRCSRARRLPTRRRTIGCPRSTRTVNMSKRSQTH